MNYKCNACNRAIGAMLNRNGHPEAFKCPNTGRIAHTIPADPVRRNTPPLPKWLEPNDLSQRAKKHAIHAPRSELI